MQLITKTWVNRVYKDTLTPAERRPIIDTVDRCREVAWFKQRGSHFSHGVVRRRAAIIETVVKPLFRQNSYVESDFGVRFLSRDGSDLEDWFEIDASGDTYAASVWLRLGTGLYTTCFGDIVEFYERRGWEAGDNDDLLRHGRWG